MADFSVIFADVSSINVSGTTVESAQSFQASRSGEARPVYTFGSATAPIIMGLTGLGQGSFSYVASNGTGSGLTTDWSAALDGEETTYVECHGVGHINGSPVQDIRLYGAAFAGQSYSMNVRGEMVVNVNFLFGAMDTDTSTF